MGTVEELRRLGHEVLTSYESGQGGRAIPDEAILAFARTEGRIMPTLNRKHFVHLHKTHADHADNIVYTFDPDFRALAQRIHKALQAQPQMTGQLVRINRPG